MKPAVVYAPESVAVVSDGKTEVSKRLAAVEVVGGEPVEPDGRFSVGYRNPSTVTLVGHSGKKRALRGASVVLIKGGRSAPSQVIGGEEDVAMIFGRRAPVTVTDDVQPQIVPAERVPRLVHDEIEDYEEEYNDAQRGPNGETLDEFHTLAHMRQRQLKDLQKKAAILQNPPTAFIKVLGGEATVSLQTTNAAAYALRQSKNVVGWQGEDWETTTVTIALGLGDPVLSASGQHSAVPLRPFATIYWGSFGQFYSMDVDIGTGIQFSLNASTIFIDVGLHGVAYTTAPAAGIVSADLRAFVSFKPSNARGRNPVRTQYVDGVNYPDGLAANGVQMVTVPPFAVELGLVQMSDTQGSCRLDFIDQVGTICYSMIVSNSGLVSPIPLAPDIVQVQVTNTGANPQHFRLPFGLGI